MIKNNKILIGKSNDKEVYLNPAMLNRHGLIAGATGTGKTVSLKVIAEGLSELGVSTFLIDIKGDLSSLALKGDEKSLDRASKMNLDGFNLKSYPVEFFDIFEEKGLPFRTSIVDLGSSIISNVLNLSQAQEGVLNIVFRIAKDLNMKLDDLKDLKACLKYIEENAKKYTLEYGNITTNSIGAILRNILIFEEEEGDKFIGIPKIEIDDLLKPGVINILDCQKLFQKPKLYSMFLIWLLTNIYNYLPECGDLSKPKLVLFFDEAHLIFENSPKSLLDKLQQAIKLIRSKGVGIFFCTQNPKDIDEEVLAQLSTRIQHALRAYSENEIKALKYAASSFRKNPNFDTLEALKTLKIGQALVSTLGEDSSPTIVEYTNICPPSSSFNALKDEDRNRIIYNSNFYYKYKDRIETQSAYEELEKIRANEARNRELEAERIKLEKEKEKLEKEREKLKEREMLKAERERERARERRIRRNERYLERGISQVQRSVTREVGKGLFKLIKNMFK